MFQQTDPEFTEEIKKYGCCLFSCFKIAEWIAGKEFKAEDVKALHMQGQIMGIIKKNCYCADIIEIIKRAVYYLNQDWPTIYHLYDVTDGVLKDYRGGRDSQPDFLLLYYKKNLKDENFHIMAQNVKTKELFNPDERLISYNKLFKIRGFKWAKITAK